MTKSYDVLEVVITLDAEGRLVEYEIPEGVVLTVDHPDSTETIYGKVEVAVSPKAEEDLSEDESETDHGHGG